MRNMTPSLANAKQKRALSFVIQVHRALGDVPGIWDTRKASKKEHNALTTAIWLRPLAVLEESHQP